MRRLKLALAMLAAFSFATTAHCQAPTETPKKPPKPPTVDEMTRWTASDGVRAQKWSGFDIGAGGNPFPSVAGLMLGFNIQNDARIGVGVGTFIHWTVYALDTKLFLTESAWAPYFGAGISYMAGQAGDVLGMDIQFAKAFVPYFQVGIDYQSDLGIHVGFNLAGAAPNGRVIVLPGIAIGWYF